MLDNCVALHFADGLFLRLRLIPTGLDRPDESHMSVASSGSPSRTDGILLQPRRGGAVFLLSCICEIEKSILARVQGIGAGWRGATETRVSVRRSVRAALRRYASYLARACCTLPRMSDCGKAARSNHGGRPKSGRTWSSQRGRCPPSPFSAC